MVLAVTTLVVEADVVDLLRELIAEVRGLRADLSKNSNGSERILSRADRVLLARLLPAIVGALGSEPTLARDLFDCEAAGLRLVLRGLNTRQIGRLLQRAEGHAVDGYLVERAGLELGVVLWRVVQVMGFSGNEKVSVPPRDPTGLP